MKKDFYEGYIKNKADRDIVIPEGLSDRMNYELKLPILVNEWSRLVSEQQMVVAKLTVDRDAKFGELVKYYRFDDQYAWSDSQIKSQVQNNQEYIKICKQLAEQTSYLSNIRDILETIKGNHFILQEYNKMKQAAEGTL